MLKKFILVYIGFCTGFAVHAMEKKSRTDETNSSLATVNNNDNKKRIRTIADFSKFLEDLKKFKVISMAEKRDFVSTLRCSQDMVNKISDANSCVIDFQRINSLRSSTKDTFKHELNKILQFPSGFFAGDLSSVDESMTMVKTLWQEIPGVIHVCESMDEEQKVPSLFNLCSRVIYKNIGNSYPPATDWSNKEITDEIRSTLGNLLKDIPADSVAKIPGEYTDSCTVQKLDRLSQFRLKALSANHKYALTKRDNWSDFTLIDLTLPEEQEKLIDIKNTKGLPSRVFKTIFSPDNTYIAYQREENVEIERINGTEFRRCILKKKLLGAQNVAYSGIIKLLFSDNKTLLVGLLNLIYTYGINEKRCVLKKIIEDEKDAVITHIAYLPDNDSVAFATSTNKNLSIKVVDMKSHRVVRELIGHEGMVSCLVAKNNLIASGSEDKTVRIWDITKPKGEECAAVLGGRDHCVSSICFDPSGKCIAVGTGDPDCGIEIWHVRGKKPIVEYLCKDRSPITFISWADTIIAKNKNNNVFSFENLPSLGLRSIFLDIADNNDKNIEQTISFK